MKIFEIQVNFKSNKFRFKVDEEREKYLKRIGITRESEIVKDFIDKNYENIVRSVENNGMDVDVHVEHYIEVDI